MDTFNKTLSHVLTFSKLIFRVLYSLLAMIDSIDWLQNRHSFSSLGVVHILRNQPRGGGGFPNAYG